MGQAKARGTFEQRQALAVKRNDELLEARRQELREREAAMTPEEKQKRQNVRNLITTMAGFAAGMGFKGK